MANGTVQIMPERKSILMTMAHRYNMEPEAFEKTLRATVVPNNCTKEQFASCLVVANQYGLNPIVKEIYFFPARGGGIVPIVGVDGWVRIINDHPAFDGMEFDTAFDGTKPVSVTCRMYRKDRSRPVTVTEFMSECGRATEPWKQSPARMLRHKAMIQAARYAFGFTGLCDPDEAERFAGDNITGTRPMPPTPPKPPAQVQTIRQIAPPEPQEPAHDAPDYTAMLEALDNEMDACEAMESIEEAREQAGWVADAPAEVQLRASKIYEMAKERVGRTADPVPLKPTRPEARA